MDLKVFVIFGIIQFDRFLITDQAWIKSAKSISRWAMMDVSTYTEYARNEVVCISNCVRSPNCTAIHYRRDQGACSHFYIGWFDAVNATEYDSVAFVRNVGVVVAGPFPGVINKLEDAISTCSAIGGSLMTENQLWGLFYSGYQRCRCSWVAEGKLMFPMQTAVAACGGFIGLVTCLAYTNAEAWCSIP